MTKVLAFTIIVRRVLRQQNIKYERINIILKDGSKKEIPINAEENLNKVFKETHTQDLDDLYLSIGSLRFTTGYIIDLIYEDKKDVIDIYLDKVNSHLNKSNKSLKGDVIVSGKDDILITIAKCCQPVKGDKIVGYITKGDGIAIHKSDCPNIKMSNRLIEVKWNEKIDNSYLTNIMIKVIKGKNQLLDIITKASQKDRYIEAVKTNEEENYITFNLSVKTNNVSQLENFINDIKSLPFVIEVGRTYN